MCGNFGRFRGLQRGLLRVIWKGKAVVRGYRAYFLCFLMFVTGYWSGGTAVAGRRMSREVPEHLEEVIVVFKTHFDIGYTDLARNVIEHYRTEMIDGALEVCAASEGEDEIGFVWMLPGWPMSEILWDGQSPGRRRQIEQALREGRFVVHALPYSLYTGSLEVEDIVRGLGYSSRISRSLGLELPRAGKMTDVPSHSWALVTVLKHSGVDFLHIGCNSTVSMPDVPLLFWWEGPDGSRVLTLYTHSYGTRLLPPSGWPYKTWLALIHTSDNQGPPSPEKLKAFMGEARSKLKGVKVRTGRLSDFSEAILAEEPELEVVRADMPDTWIHGIMGMPIETKTARNIRPQIGTLEKLNTLLGIWDVNVECAGERVSQAYDQSLMYGEHTWGYDGKCFGEYCYGDAWRKRRAKGDYDLQEQSWAEHGDYIERASSLVSGGLEENLEALARSVGVEGGRIVVFNGLPWRRDGVVCVKGFTDGVNAVRDLVTDEVLAVENEGDAVRFVARDVPATGYRTYVATDMPASDSGDELKVCEESGVLENEYLRVKVDAARGCIGSVVDKSSGRELVDNSQGVGFGGYLYERMNKERIDAYVDKYMSINTSWTRRNHNKENLPTGRGYGYKSVRPMDMSVEYRRSGVGVSAIMEAPGGNGIMHDVRLEVSLYRGLRFVEVCWTAFDKPAEVWPEAGWLCFPLKVDNPHFRLGRLGGIVDPCEEVIKGSNHDVYCLETGLSVFGTDGSGVVLCPLDSPLVSLERPGLWRYGPQFEPTDPTVYLNLFNNAWSTNFQQWFEGTWSSRVRIWAVDEYDSCEDLTSSCWEGRCRLEAGFFDGQAGHLRASQSGIEVSRKGVLLTAFGPNPDGQGLVLRLWEEGGRDGECTVTLPGGLQVDEVQPCDLRGRAVGEPIDVRDGKFSFRLGHFATFSVILKP